jgi:glycerol-1-phosphate dehydrogenase [NAD(P)+]
MYLHGNSPNRIKKALKKAGAPINAEELGIDKDNIIKALVMAREVRPERYTILNEVKLDEKKAEEVAKEVDVI